jgi:hypothetical protein
METLIRQESIRHYRVRLALTTDKVERACLRQLLKAEECREREAEPQTAAMSAASSAP